MGEINPNPIKHVYIKRCKVCSSVYYSKEITSEHFDKISNNDELNVSLANDQWTAEMMSCCNQCADD